MGIAGAIIGLAFQDLAKDVIAGFGIITENNRKLLTDKKTFLHADVDDSPKDMYKKLGFEIQRLKTGKVQSKPSIIVIWIKSLIIVNKIHWRLLT